MLSRSNKVICSPLQKHNQNNLFILFKALNTVTYKHERVFVIKFFNEFDTNDFVATYNRVYEEQAKSSGVVPLLLSAPAVEDHGGNKWLFYEWRGGEWKKCTV